MLHFKQFDSSTRFYLSDFTSAKRRIYESFRFNYQMTLPHLYSKIRIINQTQTFPYGKGLRLIRF